MRNYLFSGISLDPNITLYADADLAPFLNYCENNYLPLYEQTLHFNNNFGSQWIRLWLRVAEAGKSNSEFF